MKEKIDDICREYKIKNYTINSDQTIDVDGSVDLTRWRMDKLPLKFNRVTKNFRLNNIGLKSLEGSPKWVGGTFDCGENLLTSLKGSPEFVGGVFNCDNNDLTDLEFGPKQVGKDYNFDSNEIYNFDSLKSVKVGGSYNIHWNPVYWIFYNSTKKFSSDSKLEPYLVDWIIRAKVIKGKSVDIKRLKYVFELFGLEISLESIKAYYQII